MAKLQPLVTQPEGKNLIQACLNSQHGSLGANNTGNNLGPSPVANGSSVMTSPNLGLSSWGNWWVMPQQSSDDDGISELPTPSGPDVKHAQCRTNSSMSSHPNPSPNSANGGPPWDHCNPSLSPMSPHLPHLPPHHHPHPGLHPGPGGPTDLHHPGEVPTGALYTPTGPPHALSDPFFLFYFFPVLFCSVFLVISWLIPIWLVCVCCVLCAAWLLLHFPFWFTLLPHAKLSHYVGCGAGQVSSFSVAFASVFVLFLYCLLQ